MKIISHRGNLNGPNQKTENTVDAIEKALQSGFCIEFDIWYFANRFWLGHDSPESVFSIDTLVRWSNMYSDKNLYVHCKNIWALEEMTKLQKSNIIPFFHDADQCILLRDNIIWVHPKAIYGVDELGRSKCIAVVSKCKTAKYDFDLDISFETWYGICTDYPIDVRNSL